MTIDAPLTPVRAFVSYSWSSPTHESWVLSLATRLREDGVDVVLDKWDLKPGHDSYQFMESMVTDQLVTKVLMICDKVYVEKADNRSGGVGTESQIISPEIYKRGSQDKFAALMTDEDNEGNAHIPVFYKGRIYFDFRTGDKFEESYEQLLRWLVDRPQHVKPKLGSVPETILRKAPVATGTQSRARRVEEAMRQGLASAVGLMREYGDSLVTELKHLTPIEKEGEPFDETIINTINDIRPYLSQLSEVVSVAVRFGAQDQLWERVLTIHEQMGTLMWRTPEMTRWNSHQFDAFKVIAHDAFVSTIAIAIDEHRFDLVEAALQRPYLVREANGSGGPATSDFTVFHQYVESLEYRKQRLKLNRISLDADLMKNAYSADSSPSFESIMQADFFMFLRAQGQSDWNSNWYPHSLVYASRRFVPFPIFARAESAKFFQRMAGALGVSDLNAFKKRLEETNRSERSSRMFDHQGLPVAYLANSDNLGRLP